MTIRTPMRVPLEITDLEGIMNNIDRPDDAQLKPFSECADDLTPSTRGLSLSGLYFDSSLSAWPAVDEIVEHTSRPHGQGLRFVVPLPLLAAIG